MDQLYHQTNRMIHEIQQDLGRLEGIANEHQVIAIESELSTKMNQISGNCERLDILVNKEPPNKRQTSRMRADQVRYDFQHVQGALRNIQHRRVMRDQQKQERDLLLRTTFKTNDEEATAIDMDADLEHHSSLVNSHKGMDNILSQAAGVLESLKGQRDTLKGAKTRLLNIANTLGLSNTVMRLIEKRTTQDKLILFGGMILTSLIMLFIYKQYA